MNLILVALLHPITMMVAIFAVLLDADLQLANILAYHVNVAGYAVPIR